MKQHQVTIKDIAKTLGLSISTVSRALKNHPDISTETKKLVQDTAKDMHYEPNLLALSLRKSKSNTIGVIIPEIVHHFFSSVISGIEDLAYDKGYNIIICQSNEDYHREVINAQTLLSSRVDGIVASVSKNTFQFDHFRQFINQGIPIVFFDRVCPELNTDRVVIDDEAGGFLATEHLIKIGRKNIAHLAAPQNLAIGQGRYAGYQRALRHYNIPYTTRLVMNCDTREIALQRVKDFLEFNPDIDAVFAVNDSTAIATMQIIQQMGKKVPQDIAVVGFGDGPNAMITCPTLTTIEQKGYEMGIEAVNFVLNKIENDSMVDSFQTKVLSPALVVRDSTNTK